MATPRTSFDTDTDIDLDLDAALPPDVVNNGGTTPRAKSTPWLESFKNLDDFKSKLKDEHNHLSSLRSKFYEEKNQNKAMTKASSWKPVDQYGNPLAEATLTGGLLYFDLTKPGFYMNDDKVMIEVDKEENIKIVDPAGKSKKEQNEILCDCIGLNRGADTIEYKGPDEESTKRFLRLLRMYPLLAEKYLKHMEERIKTAEERGLMIKFDDTTLKFIRAASGSANMKKSVENKAGEKRSLSGAAYLQFKVDEVREKHLGDKYSKELIKERGKFQDHVIGEYQKEMNAVKGVLDLVSKLGDKDILKNPEVTNPDDQTKVKAMDFLLDRLALIAEIQENLKDQMERQSQKPDKGDIAFIEKAKDVVEEEVKKLSGDQKVKDVLTSLATKKDRLPKESERTDAEQKKFEAITKVQDAFTKLDSGQKAVKEAAGKHVENINNKLNTGIKAKLG